jgi:DNA-binding NarL/FixJ family response regulator
MAATLKQHKTEIKSTRNYWRGLPPQVRLLYITVRPQTGEWLVKTLSVEGAIKVELEQVLGVAAGLVRLRDDVFDAVLVGHLPPELDALDLVEGYRAGGADDPIIVLGEQSEREMIAPCYEVGADAYLCVHTATARNLIWIIARAIQRHQLSRENRRLRLAEKSRLQRERDEAERLLKEQQALIGDPKALHGESSDAIIEPDLPAELYAYCRELLRAYIIMGSGNLGDELKRLAQLLVDAGFTARHTMLLHLRVLEELLHGLGARSTRHVMTRADLLALETIIHLAEGYRRKYEQYLRPPEQLMLPDF